jgi:hypothetical protein
MAHLKKLTASLLLDRDSHGFLLVLYIVLHGFILAYVGLDGLYWFILV